MIRDHYVVLGVSRFETESGIHAAFRVLAKRYHPDVAGDQSAARFREVVEAYEILSDSERRRRYDKELPRPVAVPDEPPAATRPMRADQPEPLIPDRFSIANDFDVLRSSHNDLLQHVRSNLMSGAPKGERPAALNVVVLIPQERALSGGMISVGVPVAYACPYCRGTGRDWLSDCLRCGGAGEAVVEQPVWVRVPPFSGRRAELDVPLTSLGIRNLYLRLQLQVAT